jgi:hypothetical protein
MKAGRQTYGQTCRQRDIQTDRKINLLSRHADVWTYMYTDKCTDRHTNQYIRNTDRQHDISGMIFL